MHTSFPFPPRLGNGLLLDRDCLLGGQVPGQEQGVFPADLNLDLFVDDGPVYVPEVVDDDLFVEVGDGPYYHELEDLDPERVYQAMITGIERTIARIHELECIATEEELTEFLDWVGAGGNPRLGRRAGPDQRPDTEETQGGPG